MTEIQGSVPEPRDGHAYPLLKTNLNPVPESYRGHVVISDIDNTYLHTVYKKLSDFIRLAFEAPHDKKPIYGAPALFRGLRLGRRSESAENDKPGRIPMFFVSASPESMRHKLERRFLLDEVDFDGASFRNLWHDRTPHLRHIKEIYGYKTAALLCYRLDQPFEHKQILLGDDLEHDREIYVLYSRICAGQIRGEELDKILEHRGVYERDRQYIVTIASELPEYDPVESIFIRKVAHKSGDPTPAIFDDTDERVIVTNNYFETAVWLAAAEKISDDVVEKVAVEIVEQRRKADWFESSIQHLRSFATLAESKLISPDMAASLQSRLNNVFDRIVSGAEVQPSNPAELKSEPVANPSEGKSMTDATPAETPAEPQEQEANAEAEAPKVDYKEEISFDDFMKLDLRVATVKTCEIVKGADRLLKMELDVAGDTRTVVSGIRAYYSPEDMVGRQVIYLANLKPRKLRGIMSQGMVLAATDDDKAKLLQVDSACESGAKVS